MWKTLSYFSIFLAAVLIVLVASSQKTADAADNQAVSVGPGVRYICQTSAPAPVNRARTWVRCADGAYMFTSAANVDTQVGTGASGYATVQDEGSNLTQRATVNFTGAGVTCSDNSGSSRTDCSIPGYYSTVQDEGSNLTQRGTVNFIGSNITCVDNSGSSRTDCTITGSSLGNYSFSSNNMSTPANATFTGASSSANTVAMQHTVTLADGASGAAYAYKNSTATTATPLMSFQTSTGTAEAQIELDTVIAGSCIFRQPSTTYLGFFDSGNAGLKVQSGVVYLRDTSSDRVQVDAQGLHLNASGAAGLFPHYNTQSGTSYTAVVQDTYVGLSNTAARAVTLPSASAATGQLLIIKDEAATAGTGNITISRAGSDTIVTSSTAQTSVVINTNGGVAWLMSDGVSKWMKVN